MQYPSPQVKSKISNLTELNDSLINSQVPFDFDSEYISFKMESSNQLKLTLLNNNDEKIVVNFDGNNQVIEFSRKDTITITNNDNKLFDESDYPISLKDEL